MSTSETCRNCGALLSPDVAWCGLCLTPIAEPEPEPEPEPATPPEPATSGDVAARSPSTPADDGRPSEAFWACPVCGEENAMDLNLCPICGTSFARLFEEGSEGSRVSSEVAARSGLIPGLGHLRAGKAGDGVARMFVFGLSLVFLAIFFTADAGRWSLLVTGLYIVFCFALIAESYVDAGRAAAGERELISGRNLLWVAVGLLAVSVGIVVLLSVGVRPETI